MKTTVLMKIAVVFMAAFGAYAFSGSANSQTQQMFKRSDTCENIAVGCADIGLYICRIELSDKQVIPILDLKCEKSIYHTSDTPFKWNN